MAQQSIKPVHYTQVDLSKIKLGNVLKTKEGIMAKYAALSYEGKPLYLAFTNVNAPMALYGHEGNYRKPTLALSFERNGKDAQILTKMYEDFTTTIKSQIAADTKKYAVLGGKKADVSFPFNDDETTKKGEDRQSVILTVKFKPVFSTLVKNEAVPTTRYEGTLQAGKKVLPMTLANLQNTLTGGCVVNLCATLKTVVCVNKKVYASLFVEFVNVVSQRVKPTLDLTDLGAVEAPEEEEEKKEDEDVEELTEQTKELTTAATVDLSAVADDDEEDVDFDEEA